MSTGWLSRLLYLLIIHKHILPQGHYIIIIINISLQIHVIFSIVWICVMTKQFFPHFCVKIYSVQKYYPNTSISIILSTTTTVTTQSTASTTRIPPSSTDQYSLPTRYVKAAGIGSFHSTLKMKATRCIGPNVSNVLLSKATC